MGGVKIVSASAGSGKTYNLAYEYVRNVIREPELYRHILAVTFTNKATEEMKQRILSRIDDLVNGQAEDYRIRLTADLGLGAEEIARRAARVRSNILHDYGRFHVLTIDKFFQRIIRSFIKELGLDTDFALELPVESLLTKAADRVIEEMPSRKALREWIISFVNERIEESKQWDIRGEIISLGRETFSESYRRGLASAKPREELAKAVGVRTAEAENYKKRLRTEAEEALQLMRSNELDISDFANGASGVGGYIAKVAEGRLEEPKKRVLDAVNDGKWYAAKTDRATASRIDAIIPQLTAKVQNICDLYYEGVKAINSASLLRENYRNFALLTDLSEKITEVSREDNLLHISEINTLLNKLISGNDTPFIFEKTGNMFSHFMIDEFQDTSAMQWENFIPLLQNSVAQTAGSPVMLVGDVKQSIYRWRGGDWTILAQKAAAEFPDNLQSTLQDNWRSRRTVVEFNNAIIGAVSALDNDRLNAAVDDAEKAGAVGEAFAAGMRNAVRNAYGDYLQNPNKEAEGGYVTLTVYDKEAAADPMPPVISMIERLQKRGYRPGDIAILVRRKAEGRQVAEMLLKHKNENPGSPYSFDVITQDALAIGSASVSNFIIACMKLAGDPRDDIRMAVYNRYLGRGFTEELPPHEAQFLSGIRLRSLEEAFESIVMRYGLDSKSEEISYLQAFHEQVISFSTSNIADIPLFVEWWEESGCGESISMPPDVDAITIDTIHRAKGLGYKVVIIPFANWSMVPLTNSIVWSDPGGEPGTELGAYPVKYKKQMANSIFSEDYYREYVMSHIDNLNLFYVAVTRAKEELHLMMPRAARAGGERISSLIEEAIAVSPDGSASIGDFMGASSTANGSLEIRFGEPAAQPGTLSRQEAAEIKFTTSDIGDRVAIKLRAQRYLDDGAGDDRLAPRDRGVMMHRLFETAADATDIEKNIAAGLNEGTLDETEAAELRARLQEAFADERVRRWFDGSWDTVRSENDILLPGNVTYRPDRVMTSGSSAVVVDYKFGLGEKPGYAKQVALYMKLLGDMGYTDVKGYLWYVSTNRVVEVSGGS